MYILIQLHHAIMLPVIHNLSCWCQRLYLTWCFSICCIFCDCTVFQSIVNVFQSVASIMTVLNVFQSIANAFNLLWLLVFFNLLHHFVTVGDVFQVIVMFFQSVVTVLQVLLVSCDHTQCFVGLLWLYSMFCKSFVTAHTLHQSFVRLRLYHFVSLLLL